LFDVLSLYVFILMCVKLSWLPSAS